MNPWALVGLVFLLLLNVWAIGPAENCGWSERVIRWLDELAMLALIFWSIWEAAGRIR